MEKVIFVDQNFKALKIIKANIQHLNIDEHAEVYKNNADRALKALSKRERQFDVILLDPPDDTGLIHEALDGIIRFDILKENGIIVCEFNHKEEIDTKSFHVIKRYHYGLRDTLLLERGD